MQNKRLQACQNLCEYVKKSITTHDSCENGRKKKEKNTTVTGLINRASRFQLVHASISGYYSQQCLLTIMNTRSIVRLLLKNHRERYIVILNWCFKVFSLYLKIVVRQTLSYTVMPLRLNICNPFVYKLFVMHKLWYHSELVVLRIDVSRLG